MNNWKRAVELEANAGGKTRCEVKKLAKAKKGWKCFPVALSSTAKSDKNDKDVDDDDDYVNIRRFKSSVMLHSTDC
jgi:hypothetical protein